MTKVLEIYRNRNKIYIKFKSLNEYKSNKRKVCPLYVDSYTFFVCHYVINTYSLNIPFQTITVTTNLKDKLLSKEEMINFLIEYVNTINKRFLHNEIVKYTLQLLNLAVYT